MATFPGWQQQFLNAIHAPATPSNLRFLNSWQAAEGGGASYNPFNTTLPWAGAGSYNSVGVRNYPSAQAGVQATARTLQGQYPFYSQILQGLQAGNVPWQTLASYVEQSPWGTHNISGARSPQGGPPGQPQPLGAPQPGVGFGVQQPVAPPPRPLSQGALDAINQSLKATMPGVGPPGFTVPMVQQFRRPTQARTLPEGATNNFQTADQGRFQTADRGRVIGTPYSGTHTLGNWESDNAIDISLAAGTPIYAPTAGTIGSQFGSLGEGGRFAGLRLHLVGQGNEFYLAHLSRFAPGLKPGQRVKAGQLLGYSGSANGVNHLHIATRNGSPQAVLGV